MYFVLRDARVMNVLIRSTLKILFVHPNLYLKYTSVYVQAAEPAF